MADNEYLHLGFRAWPFRTVPDREFSSLWFDMKQTETDVKNLARSLELKPQSSINPIWGWYGMGKSHILMHLANRWESSSSKLIPVYVEFPPDAKSFLDLYSSFAEAFLSRHRDLLGKMAEFGISKLGAQTLRTEVCPDLTDFGAALRLIAFGENADVVEQWLAGAKV
ncbi:MAG: hypothetical protein ACFFER_18735, partial [Candidatus Thorarchaeota archaeon]